MSGTVALTFDDGPDPVSTPLVLDALAEVGVTATFFVIAPRAVDHAHLLARMRTEGHTVELHCDEHVRHTDLTPAEIDDDTRRALGRLAALGEEPRLWRTPWGVTAPATGEVADRARLRLVHWTADTEDWAGHDVEAMLERVRGDLRNGAIVLAHDGCGPGALRDDCRSTAELIAPLVAEAARRGLRCRALDRVAGDGPR